MQLEHTYSCITDRQTDRQTAVSCGFRVREDPEFHSTSISRLPRTAHASYSPKLTSTPSDLSRPKEELILRMTSASIGEPTQALRGEGRGVPSGPAVPHHPDPCQLHSIRNICTDIRSTHSQNHPCQSCPDLPSTCPCVEVNPGRYVSTTPYPSRVFTLSLSLCVSLSLFYFSCTGVAEDPSLMGVGFVPSPDRLVCVI
jgi:hypothetical protein